jgi:hypothetical protein
MRKVLKEYKDLICEKLRDQREFFLPLPKSLPQEGGTKMVNELRILLPNFLENRDRRMRQYKKTQRKSEKSY